MSEPTATVAIRCVNDSVAQFEECLAAILGQGVPVEVLVVDSSDHEEFAELCSQQSAVDYFRIPGKSLCEGRNAAIERSKHDYLLLTDPDCVPGPGWLEALSRELDQGAGIVGGKIVPRWLAEPPWLIRSSTLARNQLALRDPGGPTGPTDRVFGANMGFSKTALGDQAWFREDLDRVDGILLSGGDTEFCERASANGARVVYVADAIVEHQIPKRRLSYAWTMKRTFFSGVTRAIRGGRPKPIDSGGSRGADTIFMALFGPAYASGYLYGVWLKRRGKLRPIGGREFGSD